MLQAALSSIKIVNGYATNLGQRLTFGPPAEAAEFDHESLYYWPVSRQITPENKRWSHYQQWEIVAVKFSTDAALAIEQVEADLWQALSARPLLGSIDNLEPSQNSVEYEIQTAGKQAVLVRVRIELLRKTPIFTV